MKQDILNNYLPLALCELVKIPRNRLIETADLI